MAPPIKDKTGIIHKTNRGYFVEVIAFRNYQDCDVKFIYNDVVVKNLEYGAVKDGRVKNPFHPVICGKGYFGQGKYLSWNPVLKINLKDYTTWKHILERCYKDIATDKNKSYYNIATVCEEWHNFQNFAKWHQENYVEGWHLDKDILVKGNKIYSPKTCCFVPPEINTLFSTFHANYKGYKTRINKNGTKRYIAYISKNCKTYHLGEYKTEIDAIKVYQEEKNKHMSELIEKYKKQLKKHVYDKLIGYIEDKKINF